MDTAQWPQEIVVKPLEELVVTNTCPRPPPPPPSSVVERKPRPQKEQALNCPRCHSTNTKFCYYNNYSLTQPRYFCKTCRRYWTDGGSLRNIPVGGGSRKNKRSSSSSSSSILLPPSPKNIKLNIVPDLVTNHHQNLNCITRNEYDDDNNNPKVHEGQDLNLSFPNIPELVQQNNNTVIVSASGSSSSSSITTSTTTASTTSHHHHHHNFSALELITGITTTSRSSLNNFMPSSLVLATHDPNIGYTFPTASLHDFKPSLNFSLDGIGSGFGGGNLQETNGGGDGRLLFPFEDLKQISSTVVGAATVTNMDQNNKEEEQQQGNSTRYWTGMLGGGGSW